MVGRGADADVHAGRPTGLVALPDTPKWMEDTTVDRRGFRIVQRNESARNELSVLTANAERLYWRLLLACDDHGCHRAEPVTVAGSVMLGVKITVRAVEKAISELLVGRIIDAWAADDGALWMEIRGFDERQTPNMIESRGDRIAPPRPDIDDDAPPAMPVAPGGPKPDTDPAVSDAVQRVFDHWSAGEKRTGGATKAILTEDRRTRIKVRLKEGFTVEQLCECIDGFHADPFHLGQNNRDTRYTDILTLLKNAAKVDAGIAKHRKATAVAGSAPGSLVRPQGGQHG